MAGLSDTLINTLFDGRYRILRKLGSGGMANVYLAEDEELGRRVAIKILNERYAGDDLFIERFRREAKSAAGLSHPNIVSIYDRGEAEGTYYIAMEVIEGRSLKELIMTHGALPVHTAIGYAKQLLEALRFAHRHGIIHRDIKPHNVLVSADQQVKANEPRLKVTDFGIARHGASQMTEAGSIMGTAQYLSPEQARGAPVTAASDLYSAGVVLYEMLTGKVPFTGDSAIEIAMKHVNELPKPPSSLRPEIPPELDQIVLRALAKDPEDRYQTAEEFIEDLERVEAGLPISRSTATAATAILAGAAVGEATELLSESPTRVAAPLPPQHRPPTYPPSSPYDEPPRRRKRWVPWLLVGLLLAAAILAGWWVYNQIQDQLEAAEPVGVPNVVGIERDLAIAQIEDAELEAEVEEQASTEVEQGIVIEQSPPAGSRIAKGDTVTIVVSTGPNEVEIPALAGRTYGEAAAALEELGLRTEARGRLLLAAPRRRGRVAGSEGRDAGGRGLRGHGQGLQGEPADPGARRARPVRGQRSGRARDGGLRGAGRRGAVQLDAGGARLRTEPGPGRGGSARLDGADHDLDRARDGPGPGRGGHGGGGRAERAGGGGIRRRGRVRRGRRPRSGRDRAGHRSGGQHTRRVGHDRDDQGRPGLLLGATRSPSCA